MVSRVAVSLMSVALGVSLASCASSPSPGTGSTFTPTPSGTQSSIETIPPGPVFPCGVHNSEEATGLTSLGDSVALVQAVVTQNPPPVQDGELLVPVTSYHLLAGRLPEGGLDALQEAAVGTNFLPPATYLLLLGDAQAPNTYFVSDGLRGSFVISGGSALEQCPDYNGSDQIHLADSGITGTSALTDALSHALTASSSSPPASQPASSSIVTPTSGSSR